MAKIDPRPFAAQVDLSQAALAKARSAAKGSGQPGLPENHLAAGRVMLKETLFRRINSIANSTPIIRRWRRSVSIRRAIQQQQASLQAAELNLHYTNIISPVDGTVVSRNVDVGQTVAASYQTPTLFLVAKDLTKMQVDSNVSESDVGNVAGWTACGFHR